MTVHLYDSSGLLVYEGPAGSSSAALTDVVLSAAPWDPAQGPLLLTQGTWSFSYDGLDSSRTRIRNGVYLLVLENQDGSKVQKQLQVLGAGAGQVSVLAGPNPIGPKDRQVIIRWTPITTVELKIYSLDGGLARDFGHAVPPQIWNLQLSNGQSVAGGIYVITARIPGERTPQFFKLMVVR